MQESQNLERCCFKFRSQRPALYMSYENPFLDHYVVFKLSIVATANWYQNFDFVVQSVQYLSLFVFELC